MARLFLGRLATLLITCLLLIATCSTTKSAPYTRIPLAPVQTCCIAPVDASTNILLPVERASQSIPYARDEDSDLCWAAGIVMISNYLGKPIDLCRVSELRLYGAAIQCCRPVEAMDERSIILCNQGAFSGEITLALSRLGIYSTHMLGPLPEELLERELTHGRPVYVDRENGEIEKWFGIQVHGRHVVVVVGRIDGEYIVLDPSPLMPETQFATYRELRDGVNGQRRWRETWYGLSLRNDRCNPLFIPDCRCETP